MISLIVAHATNFVIGKTNSLPWYIPEDLKHFKNVTTGHTVVMGRNTYQSIIDRINKPLPNRRNIVVSRTLENTPEGIEVARSLDEALQLASDDSEIFIIGGEQLYRTALEANIVDRMYVTRVNADIAGDTFFPEYNLDDWTALEQVASQDDDYSYEFITYQKKEQA